jgi:hypothetical protein
MRNLFILFSLVLSLISPASYADAIHAKVQLMGIELIKASEKHGDELYMTITSYPSTGQPSHVFYPEPPLYWPSKYLEKLEASQIWEKDLQPGDGITLVFSLIERDVPPWNTDDLIGEVKLKLRNESGKLSSEWSIPTRSKVGEIETGDADPDNLVANLHGDGGHYKLHLKLEK